MAKCPNGHDQRLGLKCRICGSDLSYRSSIEALRTLPKVDPEYGKVSVVTVESPGLQVKADYFGEIASGQSDLRTANSFQAAAIRGGSWIDYQRKYLQDLRRWMKLVGMDKSTDKFLVIDTTRPVGVLVISALPKLEHTALIAVVADEDSTPVEQNTSYVALSLALKKGVPVIALSKSFEREMLFFTEDRGFATGGGAMSRLLAPLLEAADDFMDLLERDLKLGVKMHSLSAIVAGSKSVYGAVTNALTAQSYNVSLGTKLEEYRTVHSFVFSTRDSEAEFEKSFGAFRNRKFKGALSAELRFHETSSPLYDLLTVYGLKGDSSLQTISAGYEAIVKSVPELSVDGAS
jgi:hypothetical protein